MSSFFLLGIVYCTHTHSLTHTNADTHTPVHRQVPGCAFDAPPAKWSCCFLAPVTVETADCITSAHQRGTARWKRETISPSFHLLTSVMAVPPFFFCPPHPPSSPLLRLLCPHQRHPLSSKTWKMKWNKVWQIHCFKSSWECHSRLRAQDITTAFPLTSIQIWRGVSESCFYDGVLQWEQKEICSLFSL